MRNGFTDRQREVGGGLVAASAGGHHNDLNRLAAVGSSRAPGEDACAFVQRGPLEKGAVAGALDRDHVEGSDGGLAATDPFEVPKIS